jgi:NADPH:quinone reductase-like Zn-dependent oxidoreductase
MRAVAFSRQGPPEVLDVLELPPPTPGDRGVLVRTVAAAVNPADVGFRDGTFLPPSGLGPPWVPGLELAGEVEQVGDFGCGWKVGDRVIALLGTPLGAQADSVVVDAERLAVVPEGLSLLEAATLPLNGLTAVDCLEQLALSEGIIVVTGAAGAVGSYVVQLAARRGFDVIGVAAPPDEEAVRGCGATNVCSNADVVRRLRVLAPNGVDGVIDAANLGPSISATVRPGGRIVALRPGVHETVSNGRGVEVVMASAARQSGTVLAGLVDLVRSRDLALRPAEPVELNRMAVIDAHRRLAAGGLRSRPVLLF